MLCDNCGEREAAIHLTQIVNNSVTTLHLCERCAAEKGVETGATVAKFPLGDFLASLGKTAGAEQGDVAPGATCPFCGGTLKDFRETGRLGCAECYTAFELHLRDLLRRLHGSSRHAGEQYAAMAPAVPAATPAADSRAPAVGELREQLKRAVEAENFELAAELRDKLKVLE
jgi:protein arginine kinase activator